MLDSLNIRVIHTHDVESNWKNKSEFVPKSGELIVYDKDNVYSYERFKIGDGSTKLSDLPFTVESVVYSILGVEDNTVSLDAGRITDYK